MLRWRGWGVEGGAAEKAGASCGVQRWETWGQLGGVKAEEGIMIPREILSVLTRQLVEGAGAGSWETWVVISTLSFPTCGTSRRSPESSEPRFPDLKNGKMISFLFS